MTVRTIHVGVGGRGRWPVEVLGADPRFEPAAVVDLDDAALQEAREKLHLPSAAAFSDVRAALQAVDADAVVICTPTRTHAAYARAAFEAGKHVLVEKGMTLDWDEARALVAQAAAAGVCFCVAQNYRYNPTECAITALLSDESSPHHPGRIAVADLIHHRYRPEPRTLDYPYAMVWDMSCHHVDLLSGWLGPARRVTAVSSNPYWSRYEYDADIAAVVEYESGAVCQYGLSHAATVSDYRLILQGERGALRSEGGGLTFSPTPQAQLGSSPEEPCALPSRPRSEQGVVDDFYAYIERGIEPGISGRRNLNTLAVCEMLVRSARDRRSVESPELLQEPAHIVERGS